MENNSLYHWLHFEKRLEELGRQINTIKAMEEQNREYEKKLSHLTKKLQRIHYRVDKVESKRVLELENFMQTTLQRHATEDFHKKTALFLWQFVQRYSKASVPIILAAAGVAILI